MATVLERRRARVGRELGDVAAVRHSIGGWLRDWDLANLMDDVELVASELLTNAILHAGGDVDVVLQRCRQGVRITVRDGRPDLVILDWNAPGQPAREVVADLRADAVTRDAKVLLLVDFAHTADREVTAAGADERLAMPFSPLQLQVKLRRLLGGRSMGA